MSGLKTKMQCGVLAVATVTVLVAPGHSASATPAATQWAYTRGGPFATQAACESARPADRPGEYYSNPCQYYAGAPLPPAGGPGWYWTARYNIS